MTVKFRMYDPLHADDPDDCHEGTITLPEIEKIFEAPHVRSVTVETQFEGITGKNRLGYTFVYTRVGDDE